jgi:hypothetical protein
VLPSGDKIELQKTSTALWQGEKFIVKLAKKTQKVKYFIKDEVYFVMEDLGITEEEAIEHITKLKARGKDLGIETKAPQSTAGLTLKERMANATV